jgi:hypothetical protein
MQVVLSISTLYNTYTILSPLQGADTPYYTIRRKEVQLYFQKGQFSVFLRHLAIKVLTVGKSIV